MNNLVITCESKILIHFQTIPNNNITNFTVNQKVDTPNTSLQKVRIMKLTNQPKIKLMQCICIAKSKDKYMENILKKYKIHEKDKYSYFTLRLLEINVNATTKMKTTLSVNIVLTEIKITVLIYTFSYAAAKLNGILFEPKIKTFFHDLRYMRYCSTRKTLHNINSWNYDLTVLLHDIFSWINSNSA